MRRTPVIVTVGDARLASIGEVAEALKAKGLEVAQVMPLTGVITGSVAAARLRQLEAVEGVLSVEREAVAELPPPGAPVQ
jgi:hypothetical protein